MQATNHPRSSPLCGPDYPHSRDSPVSSLPLASSYSLALLASLADTPLSMRFMQKPSRSRVELEKASDPTKLNSIANSQLHPHDPLSSVDVSSDECSNSATPRVSAKSTKASDHEPRTGSGSPESEVDVPATPNSGHALVRKKSGEVVKSLLKESNSSVKYRSRSLPSTPTYKQVHFGGDNDVKYFKSKDRPAAILALNSPTQLYDDDEDEDAANIPHFTIDGRDDSGFIASLSSAIPRSYFDYYDDELNSHVDSKPKVPSKAQVPPSHPDWSLEFTNFSFRSYHERITMEHRPLFLENMFVSIDGKYLLGQVAVLNLAYEKSVTIRYSLDKWSTLVEMQAFYIPDSPSVLKSHNYDRFMFKIPLDLFVNCYPKRFKLPSTQVVTSELCIRFVSPGHEIWDNNDQQNYRFVLKRDAPASLAKSMPRGAKTKQDTHIKNPKYSSSYLKKRHSSIQLGSSGESDRYGGSPSGRDRPAWGSAEFDDFRNNSYYLSSPLLSYTARNNFKDLLIDDQLSKEPDSHADGRTFSADFSDHLRISDSPSDESSPSPQQDDEAQNLETSSKRKPHESMSYKELLDSYCFFNSNGSDGGSKTTLVLSEEPGTNLDPANVNSTDAENRDSVFTVSSFLK